MDGNCVTVLQCNSSFTTLVRARTGTNNIETAVTPLHTFVLISIHFFEYYPPKNLEISKKCCIFALEFNYHKSYQL